MTIPSSPLSLKPSKEYAQSLDGLRGISIIFVFISHYGVPMLPGAFGVTIFFFVSGFLITRLLQYEFESTGTISLKQFYIRRILRLGPALITFVIFFGGLWWYLFDIVRLDAISAAIFYYFNYFKLLVGDVFPPYNVLWSLAVEEHYYIIFPALFLLLRGINGRFVTLFLSLILIILIWRYVLHEWITSGAVSLDTQYLKKSTDTRFDSIVFGALLASLVHFNGRDTLLRIRNKSSFVLGLVLIIIGLSFKLPIFSEYSSIYDMQFTLRYTLTGLGLFFVLNYVLFSVDAIYFRQVLSKPLITYLGKLSYSIYLWHLATLVTLKTLYPDHVNFSMYLISTFLTFFFAMLSYHLVEKNFIKIRKLHGSNAR